LILSILGFRNVVAVDRRFFLKTKGFLRFASILALLACLGHTFLFVTYVPSHGPEETAVVTAMKVHRFNFGGFTHSYWELYFGYGLFVSIGCFVECVLFWQLGDLGKSAFPRSNGFSCR